MTQHLFDQGDWQAVIAAHPLESHDPQEWLRYGVALLQTMEPGPDVGKQQQQAALAFVQAQKEGATAEQVAAMQRQSVLLSLREALKLAEVVPTAGHPPPSNKADHEEATSLSTIQKPRIIIVGNCQAFPLSVFLRNTFNDSGVWHSQYVHLATKDDVSELSKRLETADLLVVHRIQEGYRNNIGLDSRNLRTHLPTASQAVIIPTLHYEGYYPWIGYSQQQQQDDASNTEIRSPLGVYHDFLAMSAAQKRLDPRLILKHDVHTEVINKLRENHRESIKQLQLREQDCDVAISDWIDARHRLLPLFHTVNHPAKATLDELSTRLFAAIDFCSAATLNLSDPHDHLGELTIPIHPWVSQALKLGPWAESWGQNSGSRLRSEDQMLQSYKFYTAHPWIAEANQNHSKMMFANEILHILLSR